jgi:hypothetical protein
LAAAAAAVAIGAAAVVQARFLVFLQVLVLTLTPSLLAQGERARLLVVREVETELQVRFYIFPPLAAVAAQVLTLTTVQTVAQAVALHLHQFPVVQAVQRLHKRL